MDAFKTVGDGRATKIIIPSELAESASQLQFVAEMLGVSGTPVDTSAKKAPEKVVEDPCCDKEE